MGNLFKNTFALLLGFALIFTSCDLNPNLDKPSNGSEVNNSNGATTDSGSSNGNGTNLEPGLNTDKGTNNGNGGELTFKPIIGATAYSDGTTASINLKIGNPSQSGSNATRMARNSTNNLLDVRVVSGTIESGDVLYEFTGTYNPVTGMIEGSTSEEDISFTVKGSQKTVALEAM